MGLESILKMNIKTYPLKEVLLGCSQDQFIYKISKLYRTVAYGQDAVQLNLETVTIPVVSLLTYILKFLILFIYNAYKPTILLFG